MECVVRGAAPCAELWVSLSVEGGNNPRMGDGLRVPSVAIAVPGNMSQWEDQNEEEFHDEEKVGSKRPRGSRGPEGKLAQKARTLRQRTERAEGHLNAAKPRYWLGTMTEQSFEQVVCHPVAERDLHNAWRTSTTPGRPCVVGSRAAPRRGMQWKESGLLRRAKTKPNVTFTSSATSCDRRRESG